jgi:hypothetical protein
VKIGKFREVPRPQLWASVHFLYGASTFFSKHGRLRFRPRRSQAMRRKPDSLSVVRALIPAGFVPGLDGPAEGLQLVVLGVVPAKRDA